MKRIGSPQPSQMSSIKYRPEIDGLRTVAIIPVILFHLGFQWIQGGFLGVDVFFAISGFLITSIILREVQKDTFSLYDFGCRRIRRILPALVVCIAVTMAAIYAVGYRNELGKSASQALAALLSYSNIHTLKTAGDYWGGQAEDSPFLHCWSLSTEEQFYIFFPLAFVWLVRRSSKWALFLLSLGIVGSLGVFLIGSVRAPTPTFYLLPTRAWEIGAGCLVAFVLNKRPGLVVGRKAAFFQTTGLLIIVSSYFLTKGGGLGPMAILPITGATLFLLCDNSRSGAGRVLASAPVVFIGKISYSLYLWHWPVIVVQKLAYPEMEEGYIRAAMLLGITVVLSLVSYYFVETPCRNPRKRILPILCGVAACGGALAVTSRADNYLHYDTSAYARLRYHGDHYSISPERPVLSRTFQRVGAGVESLERAPGQELLYKDRGLIKRYGGERPSIMVIGDSHGAMWSSLIDSISSELKVTTSFFSVSASNPFIYLSEEKSKKPTPVFTPTQKQEFDEARIRAIKEWKPLIIFSAAWAGYKDREVVDLLTIARDAGCKVLLIEQPPKIDFGDRNSTQYFSFLKIKPIPGGRVYYRKYDDVRVKEANLALRDLLSEFPFVSIVPTYDLFSMDDKAAIMDGNEILYFDDDHLSEFGTGLARARMESAIKKAMVPEK